MRIISQNGSVDVNYTRCVLEVYENHIKAVVGDKHYDLAQYPNNERVKEVMKDLHYHWTYFSGNRIFCFPKN